MQQDLETTDWALLMAGGAFTPEQLLVLQARVEREERAVDEAQARAQQELQQLAHRKKEAQANLERLAEYEDVYQRRQDDWTQLEALNAALDQQVAHHERKLAEQQARASGVRGLEREMGAPSLNKLLSIVDQAALGKLRPLRVEREDDHELFLSVTDEAGALLCEQFLPKALLM